MSTTLAAEADTALPTDDADAPARPSLRDRLVPPMPSDRLWGWLGPLGITLLAAVLRLWRLDEPSYVMFDEEYYARDALRMGENGAEYSPEGTTEGFVVHPPIGKWLIAIGEAAFNVTAAQVRTDVKNGEPGGEFGFRIAAAVVGILSVLILCRLVRRMTRSTLLGCFAGLLLTLDGLHFVQSRIAMLDIFLMFFLLAAFACLVVDRDRMRERLAAVMDAPPDDGGEPPASPRLGIRWWRIAGAVCLGLALGTKWTAVYFLVAYLLLSAIWDLGARRAAEVRRPVRAWARREPLAYLGIFLLIPAAVYVMSWAGWFASDDGWKRTWAVDNPVHDTPFVPDAIGEPLLPAAAESWFAYHEEILDFHTNLAAKHTYQSKPLSWLPMTRPVAYEYESVEQGKNGCTSEGGCSREVLGIGTPMIWWASMLALLGCVYLWAARRDWRAASAVTLVAFAILPWVRESDRTMFLFYALPALPFMVIAITLCAGLVLGRRDASPERRRWGAAAVGAYTLLVVANFFGIPGFEMFGLYPILSDLQIPYSDWDAKTWFTSWV